MTKSQELSTAALQQAFAETEAVGVAGRRLSKAEMRQWQPKRREIASLPRLPITLVLDGLRRHYDIGAMLRLADAFCLQELVVCAKRVKREKRSFLQASCGSDQQIPWSEAESAVQAVAAAKAAGASVLVLQQTTTSVAPEAFTPKFPVCLIVASERRGVPQEVIDLADAAVAIPSLGVASPLNIVSASAIVLYWLTRALRPGFRAPEASPQLSRHSA
jgi:tRNA G18 (ribose-2'-O)-methylase SpoU